MSQEPNSYTTERLVPEVTPLPPQQTAQRRVQPRSPARSRWLAFVLIGIGVAMLFGNLGNTRTKQDEVRRSLGNTQSAQIDIETGNGSITIGDTADAASLVSGNVSYRGSLNIQDNGDAERELRFRTRRDGFFNLFGSNSASWNLQLNTLPRYRLETDTGNGTSRLDLRRLLVERLEVSSGNGQLFVVLPERGAVEGEIDTGNGYVELTLPPGRAARIEVDMGNGSISAPGLTRTGGRGDRDGVYETVNFAGASPNDRITLSIDTGNGNVAIK